MVDDEFGRYTTLYIFGIVWDYHELGIAFSSNHQRDFPRCFGRNSIGDAWFYSNHTTVHLVTGSHRYTVAGELGLPLSNRYISRLPIQN